VVALSAKIGAAFGFRPSEEGARFRPRVGGIASAFPAGWGEGEPKPIVVPVGRVDRAASHDGRKRELWNFVKSTWLVKLNPFVDIG
jgi:hypothetical protein